MEEETSKDKALRNNVVITNIAQYLDPTDLTKLRGTCKLWNKCMIPALAKTNSVVVALTQDNVNDFLSTISSKSNQYHQHLPYSRYKCKNISFRPKLYNSLFTKIGSSLTHLKFVTSAESSAVQITLIQFRRLIFNLAPRLVKLEVRDRRESVVEEGGDKLIGFWNQGPIFDDGFPSITLPSLEEIVFELVDADGIECEQFMADFFNSAINLSQVAYDNNSTVTTQNVSLLRGMSMTAESKDLSKLSCLTLDWVTNQEIELLIELARYKKLHLVAFTILRIGAAERVEGGMECHNLSIFLNLQSETLVDFNLSIDDELSQTQQYLKLYKMKVLQGLTLNTRNFGEIEQYINEPTPDSVPIPIQFDNEAFSSFSSVFPQLKRFEYKYTVVASPVDDVEQLTLPLAVLQSPSTPHPGVEILEVETVCNKTQLNNLSLLFPCITKLSLMLLPDTILTVLPLIWVKWLQLTKLKLSYLYPLESSKSNNNNEKEDKENIKLLDTAITGIPCSNHTAFLDLLLKNSSPPDRSNVINNLLIYKTGPGLSDLKYLRKLKVDLPWRISDVSCLVLWSAHELTQITLLKGNKISPYYCKKLVQGSYPNLECSLDLKRRI